MEEKHRFDQIAEYVASLYREVMERRKGSETSLKVELPPGDIKTLLFNTKDKAEIRNCLTILLPECSIRYRIIPVENTEYPNVKYSKEFLVINWT
jgi:hypothetical protein